MTGKSILESLLLDEREECVRRVAGMTWNAAHVSLDLSKTLAEIEQAIGADPEKAKERVRYAALQCRHLHSNMKDNLDSFVRYVERPRGTA